MLSGIYAFIMPGMVTNTIIAAALAQQQLEIARFNVLAESTDGIIPPANPDGDSGSSSEVFAFLSQKFRC